MVNLGSSLLVLGLLVPVFTRLKTEKKHKKELLAQKENMKSKENVTFSEKNGNSDHSDVFKNIRTGVEKNSTFQSFRRSYK